MRRGLLLILAGLACAAVVGAGAMMLRPEWSAKEIEQIASLSLAKLPPLRPDASNRVSDDPAAAALGHELFFDTRLSADGTVSCASCHQPDRQFQDGLAVGHGVANGTRRTMPIAGTAYFPFLFWDGRKDSQWAQALGPLENPVEHGADRTMVVRLIAAGYRDEYERIFGPLPDLKATPEHAMPDGPADVAAAWATMSPQQQDDVNRTYANIGKAIAAFERTIAPQPSRFDVFADALSAGDTQRADTTLTPTERAGLKLFIGRANCLTCHNGPLFSDGVFHNIGLPASDPEHDGGRSTSVALVKADPFNCLGPYSDAKPASCTELKFMEAASPDLVGAFRSPSLRGVTGRPPFMHAGQFASLDQLLDHYNRAPAAVFGRSELTPLGLSQGEIADLAAFLNALTPDTEAQPTPVAAR
ncbi:MAG TPA: cytochrome c peroxidase [Bauldia sp.]|nr:cytochrome c peroxidase [Bauldia sp.]